jgi:hypothetical protein
LVVCALARQEQHGHTDSHGDPFHKTSYSV